MVRVPGSFRDPHGHVFRRDGVIFRRIEPAGAADYDAFMASGLHAEAVGKGWLVDHTEEPAEDGAHRILRPTQIPMVSWPYEWPFGALQAAGLLTLDLATAALRRGLVLRDASAYNVQFLGEKPIFIDTSSFGAWRDGEPWIAYGQFCRHFLAPLALMSRVDIRLGSLLRTHIDGVPLDLASRLLPWGSLASPGLLVHLHLHARYGAGPTDSAAQIAEGTAAKQAKVSKTALLGLLDGLRSAVAGLSWAPRGTTWGDYYAATNYTDEALAEKERLVRELVGRAPERALIWDLGSNTGRMLRAALPDGSRGVSLDVDPAAVEAGWRQASDGRVLHLVQDLVNPSPSQGWGQEERAGLAERGPADVALALALVHHLAIGNNVPLPRIADVLATLARNVVIEFVPKEDSQVVRMLSGREDIFVAYDEAGFEAAMRTRFTIEERVAIPGTARTLWRLRR